MPARKRKPRESAKPPGKPTKLTPEVQEILVTATKAGVYRATAAEHAGIHVGTFYAWLEKGEAHHRDDVASPFRELHEALKKAEADFQVRALLQIEKAAHEGTWQAAAWRLERKHPELWGRTDRFAQAAHEALMAERNATITERLAEQISLAFEEAIATAGLDAEAKATVVARFGAALLKIEQPVR